jgi:hypothetical protein
MAVDKSSTGELALWALPDQPEAEAPPPADRALYATAAVPDVWPLTGGAVEAARARLMQSVAAEGRHAVMDPLSFRLRISGPGRRVELWTRLEGPSE